jgi:hypothetical protein
MPDFGSEFSVPDQRILVFLTQKNVSMLPEKLSGMFIPDPDPDFFHPGFRIQGSKKHWILDPDPQH